MCRVSSILYDVHTGILVMDLTFVYKYTISYPFVYLLVYHFIPKFEFRTCYGTNV